MQENDKKRQQKQKEREIIYRIDRKRGENHNDQFCEDPIFLYKILEKYKKKSKSGLEAKTTTSGKSIRKK